MKDVSIQLTYGGLELVQDWRILANCIGLSTRVAGHAVAKRPFLQTRRRRNGRTVYRSETSLKAVQNKMAGMLEWAFARLPLSGCAIACRKDVRPHRILERECVGKAVVVKTDVRRYYDNVRRSSVERALVGAGFPETGAKAMAQLLVVDRKMKKSHIQTLQQGSPASPAVANLVGRETFDVPIAGWLEENMTVPYKYYRYSDNITIVLDDDPGSGKIAEYKKFVRNAAASKGFRVHAWETLRPNNKLRPQTFLGVVLNRKECVRRKVRDRFEAMLVTALTTGIGKAADRHFSWAVSQMAEEDAEEARIAASGMPGEEKRLKFAQKMRGYAAYVKDVNPSHAGRVEKLSALLVKLAERGGPDFVGVDVVRSCRRDEETTAQFIGRAMQKIEG